MKTSSPRKLPAPLAGGHVFEAEELPVEVGQIGEGFKRGNISALMSAAAEAVIQQAAQLSAVERWEVIDALSKDLDPPSAPVDEAMLDRRWAEIESGAVKCLTKAEFMIKLRSRP